MRRSALLFAAAVALLTPAHIGSPDTWFSGRAGPYPVRVLVRSPGVIPGLADLTIWTDSSATAVWATPAYYNAGDRGLPPADTAKVIAGQPGAWSVPLWIMISGSYNIRISVNGAQGVGTAVVPVSMVATTVREMPPQLGLTLGVLGLVLVAGLVTIVGAAARESVLVPGEEPDLRRRRRGWIAMGTTVVLVGLILWGGRLWWQAEDRAYRRGVSRQWRTDARVTGEGADRRLHVAIADSIWQERRVTPLVPDHGKLMHLFLASADGGNAFAHLHPVSRDSSDFETALPPLPAGRYRVFADITHESGFARTLIGSVVLPEADSSNRPADPDDGWRIGPADDSLATLPDGATVTWLRPPALRANEDGGLRMVVRERDGSSGAVEPYLGMAGHAVVMREDGGVFIHLHPMGTISAAAQVMQAERTPADTVWGALGRRLSASGAFTRHAAHPGLLPGEIEFPYAFPDTGSYRVWVQVKRGGRIETVAFRARVE